MQGGDTGAHEKEIPEPFQAVLETEKHWLASVCRAEDLTGWRSRLVREVMDRRSPYAQALRRSHGEYRLNEFHKDWQLLIATMLDRMTPSEPVRPDEPATVPVMTTRPEDVAIAILAALHGGATLSWLAEDARPLEAALDIALAPVLSPRRPSGSGDRSPR